MEDFYYKDAECMYFPHPKLYGKYEVWLHEEYIGRFNTKAECKKNIDDFLNKMVNI